MTCDCDFEPVAQREMIKLVYIQDYFFAKKGDVVYADRAYWKYKDNTIVSYWFTPEDFGKSYAECRVEKQYLEQVTPDPLFQLVFTQYFNGVCVGEIDFPSMEWDEVSLAAHSFARSMNIPETRRNFWELDTPDIGYKIRIDKVEV
jgi:hypothetical protein